MWLMSNPLLQPGTMLIDVGLWLHILAWSNSRFGDFRVQSSPWCTKAVYQGRARDGVNKMGKWWENSCRWAASWGRSSTSTSQSISYGGWRAKAGGDQWTVSRFCVPVITLQAGGCTPKLWKTIWAQFNRNPNFVSTKCLWYMIWGIWQKLNFASNMRRKIDQSRINLLSP